MHGVRKRTRRTASGLAWLMAMSQAMPVGLAAARPGGRAGEYLRPAAVRTSLAADALRNDPGWIAGERGHTWLTERIADVRAKTEQLATTPQEKTILFKLGPLFDGGRIPDEVKDNVNQALLKALPVEGERPVFHSELRDHSATLAITVNYHGWRDNPVLDRLVVDAVTKAVTTASSAAEASSTESLPPPLKPPSGTFNLMTPNHRTGDDVPIGVAVVKIPEGAPISTQPLAQPVAVSVPDGPYQTEWMKLAERLAASGLSLVVEHKGGEMKVESHAHDQTVKITVPLRYGPTAFAADLRYWTHQGEPGMALWSKLPDAFRDWVEEVASRSVRDQLVQWLRAQKELTRQQQFDGVAGALATLRPELAQRVRDNADLLTESNPDAIRAKIQALPISAEDQSIVLLAFLTPAEGAGSVPEEPPANLAPEVQYRQGIPGLLVWPQRNFYTFGGAPVELQSLIRPTITPEQALTVLREAKDKSVELSVSLHLRGVDGPGSSLDLPEFQLMLTPPGTSDLTKLPSTLAIASAFRVKMTVSLAENPEAIEYVAPDYGIPAGHPDTVVGPVHLNARGMTPRYYRDAPAFIFRNVFGLKGIRITLEEIPAMAKAGGMESSNAFSVGLIAVASMLSRANLSQAEIFNLAIRLEDVEFGNLTGGQGHLSSIFGGAYRHIWLSGVTDASGRHLLNPYAAFSVSELSRDALERAAGHMMLAQAGKDYVNGKPKGSRTAGLINFIWTDLLRDRDEIGFALHQEKLGLAARYAKALADGDFATVVETVNRYVDIRDTLCRRWISLALDAEQGQPGPAYAKNYANKVFHPDRARYVAGERPEDFEDIRTRYHELEPVGRVEELRTISFYTLDPIATLVQEARKEGIAVMPLGAGGPGTNLMVVSSQPNGQEHLRQFFEKINTHPRFADHPFEALTEARAREIMSGTGTLRGFIPFEVGHEPMQLAGFQQLETFQRLGLREPAPPQPIGPSAPSSEPKMEVVPKAPAVDPALLKSLRTALEPRNLHEGLQQALQTPPAGQPLRIYHLSPTSLERYATYLQGGFERIAQLPVRATTFVAKKDERREDFEARMRDEAHGEQTDITLIEWHGAETEIPLIEAAYTGRLVVLVHRPEELILRYGEGRMKELLSRADAVVLLGPAWVAEYERLLPGKVVVAIPHGFFDRGDWLDEARLSPGAVAVVGSNTTWGEMRHLEDVLSLKTALDRHISTTGSQARVVAYVAGKFDQRVQGQLYKDRDDVWWLTNHDILTAQQGGAFHDEVSFRSWLYEQAHGRVIVRAHVEDSRVVPESFESREHADLARWEQQLVDFNVQLYHEILKDRRQANPHAPKAEYAGTLHLNGGPAIGVVFDSPTMSDVADYERFQVVRVALQPDGQPVVEGAARDILQLIEEPERRKAVVEANVALADRLRMDEIAYGYYLLSQTLTQRSAQEPTPPQPIGPSAPSSEPKMEVVPKPAAVEPSLLEGLDLTQEKTIAIIGGLGSLPERFLKQGYHDIQAQFPNVRFIIVGRRDPKTEGDYIHDRLVASGLPLLPGLEYLDEQVFEGYATDDGYLEIEGRRIKIDGIIESVPTNLHLPLAQRWVARGVPVWMEKPITMIEELPQVRQLAADHPNKVFAADFFMDSDTLIHAVKDPALLKSIGRIRAIHGRVVENWSVANEPRPWLMKPKESGGGLGLDILVHPLAVIATVLEAAGMDSRQMAVDEVVLGRSADLPATVPKAAGAPGQETYMWMRGHVPTATGGPITFLVDGGKGVEAVYYGLTIEGEAGTLEIMFGTEEHAPYLRLTQGNQTTFYRFEGGGLGYGRTSLDFLLLLYGSSKTAGASLDQRLRATTQSVELVGQGYAMARASGLPLQAYDVGSAPAVPTPVKGRIPSIMPKSGTALFRQAPIAEPSLEASVQEATHEESSPQSLQEVPYLKRLKLLGVRTQRPEDMGSLQQGFWAPAFPEAVSYTISPDLGAAAADVSRVRRIVIHSSVLATSPVAEIAYQRLQQQLQQVLGDGPRAIDFVIVPNELPEAEQQALIMKPIGTAVFEIAAIIGPKDWATALRKTVATETAVVASASEQNGSVPRWEEALIAGVEAAVAADPRLLPIIGRLHVAVEGAEGLFSVEAEPLAMEAVEPEIRQAVLTSRTLAGSK